MGRKLLNAAAAVVTLLAIFVTSSASAFLFYQPKAPKSLTK